jgi:hypothetical protein
MGAFLSQADWAQWITAVGLLLAWGGLVAALWQLKQTRNIALGEFLLHIDEMMLQHEEVHLNLRPGGPWTQEGSGPESAEEWAAVDAYMGLFERVYILSEENMVDLDIISRLYGYRIRNIVANERIRQAKLVDEADLWRDFADLCERVDVRSNKGSK